MEKIVPAKKVLRDSLPSVRETRKIKTARPSLEHAKRYFRTKVTYVCDTQLTTVARIVINARVQFPRNPTKLSGYGRAWRLTKQISYKLQSHQHNVLLTGYLTCARPLLNPAVLLMRACTDTVNANCYIIANEIRQRVITVQSSVAFNDILSRIDTIHTRQHSLLATKNVCSISILFYF